MTTEKKKRFRYNLWINWEVQGRLVLFYLLGCAVITALLVCFVFTSVWGGVLEEVSLAPEFDTQAVYQQALRGAVVAGGVVFVLCALAGALVLSILSHRVAGPLVRIKRMLETGRPIETHELRGGDSLKDVYALARALRTESIAVSERYQALAVAVAEACDRLESDEQSAGLPADVLARLRELAAHADDEPEAP